MDFIKSEFFLYILAWFSTMTGVWLLFDRAETVLKDDVRTKLSAWLKNDNAHFSKGWPAIFIAIFDRFFGEKHFSWKCFLRSSVASICTVIIVTIIFYLVSGTFPLVTNDFSSLWLFLCITFFLNIIPDYFSLLQTRKILHWMRNSNVFIRLFLVVLDFILTNLIIIVSLNFILFIYFSIFTSFGFVNSFNTVVGIISNFSHMTTFMSEILHGEEFIFSIWIYSTFATSVWIWFFVVSSFVIKFFGFFRKGLGSLKKIFNVDEKPLRTLGFVSMLLVTLIFIIAPLL